MMLYDKLQSITYFFGYYVYDKTYFIKNFIKRVSSLQKQNTLF